MSREHTSRLRSMFYEAVELDRAEREAHLRRIGAESPELIGELRALLISHDESHGFLETPAAVSFASSADPGRASGEKLGAYRLIEPVGRGGMGEVWRAEQSSPRRSVALKLLPPATSDDALRRFALESEVLGRLRHAGIAQVFESGTADTRSGPVRFLAMEFVEGRRLIEYADAERLDARSRVKILREVCAAVDHAHRNGVIHRDLKPANILVDAQGRPKVLDFGIARVVDGESPSSRRTRAGEIVGTLGYMSPEQVVDGGNVDTRSDVYALGVLLYELMSGGRLPIDVAGLGVAEALSRISRADPEPLPETVAGELRTIIMKALDRDPDDRYGSAAELGADLDRFLNDEPILAYPPSSLYQFRKFVRRNRGLAWSVAGVAVVLAIGSIVATAGWLQALEARRLAQTQASRAEEINRVLRDALESPSPDEGGRQVTMVEFLDGARERIDRDLADRPALRADLLGTLANTYLELGETERAEPLLREATDALAAAGEEFLPRRIEVESVLAWCESETASLDVALERAAAMVRLAETRLPEEHRATQYALHTYGSLLDWADDLDEAERVLSRALDLSERLLGEDHFDTITTRANLAGVLRRLGRVDEATEQYERVLADRRRTLGENAPDTIDMMNQLGFLLHDIGDGGRAEDMFRESLERRTALYGEIHARTAVALHNLGWFLVETGREDEAVPYVDRAIEIADEVHGDDHWIGGTFRVTAGRAAASEGRVAEARELLTRAIETLEDGLGAGHSRVVSARRALADLP